MSSVIVTTEQALKRAPKIFPTIFLKPLEMCHLCSSLPLPGQALGLVPTVKKVVLVSSLR